MISKNRVKIIAIIIAILIIIIFSYIFINNKSKNSEFDHLINRIDFSINKVSPENTKKLCGSAFHLARTSLQYKRLLKRIYSTSDFHFLYVVSEKAYAKYPNDENILSIYLFSLLRIGENEKAFNILLGSKAGRVNDNLKLETNISWGKYDPNDNIFYRVLDDQNTLVYEDLYKKTSKKEFLIDAALLNLEKGKYENAYSIFSELGKSDDLQYLKLQFFIEYYSDHFNEALKLLSLYDFGFNIHEIQLIRIDILIKQKKYSDAKDALNNYLKLYPEDSPTPYTNLILLNSFNFDSDIENDIKKALLYFPDNKQLLLSIIDYYTKSAREEESLSILNNYLKRNSHDTDLDIILKQLKGVTDPEFIVNSVRLLVNQKPGKKESSRFLAFNLYQNNDMKKLEKFLDQTSSEQNTGWIMFFKALIFSFKGNFKSAVEDFQLSYTIEPNWESLYNLAIISKYKKDYQGAISYFQRAENSITPSSANIRTKSMIRTELAQVFYDLKDFKKAYRELKNALDQDKNNLKANLLLNKLESTSY